jgi:hypothetical protein
MIASSKSTTIDDDRTVVAGHPVDRGSEPELDRRWMEIAHGPVLGGSSSINAPSPKVLAAFLRDGHTRRTAAELSPSPMREPCDACQPTFGGDAIHRRIEAADRG